MCDRRKLVRAKAGYQKRKSDIIACARRSCKMPETDPRIDAYIDKTQDFAKPIMKHIRALVHKACPDVAETMKWSFPHFDYKGMMCSMAAFKEHCAFGFWKQSLLEDSAFPTEKTAMGSFGRLTTIADLPDDKTMKKLIAD